MCDPATLAATTLIIGATSSISSYVGQAQAAQAQVSYQSQLEVARNQQIQENAQIANASLRNEYTLEGQRQLQDSAKASQDIQQESTAALKAKATAQVSAGEAGVEGLSVDQLMEDFDRQEGQYRDSVTNNREMSAAQSQMNMTAMQAQAQGQIASIRPYVPSPVVQPSFLTPLLQIGGSSLETWDKYTVPETDNQGNRTGRRVWGWSN